jgi:hypothetical protein
MKTSGKALVDERIAKAHASLWLTNSPHFPALIGRNGRLTANTRPEHP